VPFGCLSDRRRCEPIGENCWTIRDGGGAADVLPFAGYERLRCQQHRQTQMARWWCKPFSPTLRLSAVTKGPHD
jgi:hypothetical protein